MRQTGPYSRHPMPADHTTIYAMPPAFSSYCIGTDGSHAATGWVSFGLLWLKISLRHADLAERHQLTEEKAVAVRDALRYGERTVPPEGEVPELDASVLAIAASAFALDAFYGATEKMVKRPLSEKASRHRQIFELLKHGFKVGRNQGKWKAELEWLFDTRDSSVHHREEERPLVPRISTGEVTVLSAPEASAFSAESARRAADFAVEVYRFCLMNPKPPVAKWAEDHRIGFMVVVEKPRR